MKALPVDTPHLICTSAQIIIPELQGMSTPGSFPDLYTNGIEYFDDWFNSRKGEYPSTPETLVHRYGLKCPKRSCPKIALSELRPFLNSLCVTRGQMKWFLETHAHECFPGDGSGKEFVFLVKENDRFPEPYIVTVWENHENKIVISVDSIRSHRTLSQSKVQFVLADIIKKT